MVVTFFGQKPATPDVYTVLLTTITNLIEDQYANIFYVGNDGEFDRMAQRILKMLSREYPHIRYVVLPFCTPMGSEDPERADEFRKTVILEELAGVPKRKAREVRNRWMLDAADIVVTYVRSRRGVAEQWKMRAKADGRTVIELHDKKLQAIQP